MAFEEQLPQWENEGTQPPQSKRVEGWLPNEKPPASWFNWLFGRTYRVLKELQEKAALNTDLNALDQRQTNHENNKNNPHNVTKDQVGLGNVDNVQQASKAEFDAHKAETETWQRYKLTSDNGHGKGGFFSGDLNDLVDTGIYSVSLGTNRPVEVIGNCIVIRRSTSQLQQMYATVSGSESNRDRVFLRTSMDNGATWSDWVELINSNGGTMAGSLFIDGGDLYRSFSVRREVSGNAISSSVSVNTFAEAQLERYVDGNLDGVIRIEGRGKYNFDNFKLYFGEGAPEGAVTAPQGSLYLRTDGGENDTLWVKTSGTGNTGWTAK